MRKMFGFSLGTTKPFVSEGVKHATINGTRVHLRKDEFVNLLWVNGANLLVLNKEATDLTESTIEAMWEIGETGKSFLPQDLENAVIKKLKRRYSQVPEEMVKQDLKTLNQIIESISKGLCPIDEIGLGMKEINPTTWTAPARMDLALTYRCNNNCSKCYMGGPKNTKELTTEQWEQILSNLWKIGVPHVVFTGGEPTVRDDLIELVDCSEKFVTGLITNGRKLPSLADDLFEASLDYVQITLEAPSSMVHDEMVQAEGAWRETMAGIKKATEVGLSVVTNTTLTQKNYKMFPELILLGKDLGLKTMACNSLICSGKGSSAICSEGLPIDEVKSIIEKALKVAKETGIDLQWYSPTCYLNFNPIELGFGPKHCSAAQYNMTIEPNGQVLPCQSWIHESCGNMLNDSWTSIWNHPTCKKLRAKEFGKEKDGCKDCNHFKICGGGCPLDTINGRDKK